MAEPRRNPRRSAFVMDMFHLVLGVVIVVLAVMAFLSPDEHHAFFPLIFFLSAILSIVSGFWGLMNAGRNSRKKLTAAWSLLFGLAVLVVGVISAMVML